MPPRNRKAEEQQQQYRSPFGLLSYSWDCRHRLSFQCNFSVSSTEQDQGVSPSARKSQNALQLTARFSASPLHSELVVEGWV